MLWIKLMDNLVDNLNRVTNSFWGIAILFTSVWMCVHGFTEAGYYFAGVGSTLLGIKHNTDQLGSVQVQTRDAVVTQTTGSQETE